MILLSIQKASYSYEVFPPFQQRQLLGSVLHNCPPIVNTGLLKFLITVPYKIPFRMEERSKTLEESQGIWRQLFLYRFVFSHILSILSTTPQHFSRIYTALHFCYLRLSMAIFQLSAHQASFTHWNVSVPNRFTLKSGIHQCFLTWIFFVIHESIENGLRPCVWTNDEGLTASENSNTHF